MKLRHRTLALILSAIMTITYMPSLAFAAEEDPAVDATGVVTEESDSLTDDESPATEEEQIDLQAEGDIASGTSGTCDWVIDASGCLTISAGELDNESYPAWTAYGRREKITSVKINGNVKALNCTGMFYDCENLVSADLSGMDTSDVLYMDEMFDGCEALTSVNISSFDTSNVRDMNRMFYACYSLTDLDVSGFDTSNVTDMHEMFCACSSLSKLEVNHFDTKNVTNMSSMFSGCSSLTALDVSNFNTSKVTDMGHMFSSCEALTALELKNFDTSNVTDMCGMFSYCSSLKALDVSSFRTPLVTDMSGMFSDCPLPPTLDLSGFDTSNVTSMSGMFQRSFNTDEDTLQSLDLSSFNTSKVSNMDNLFNGRRALTTIKFGSEFDTTGIENMSSMFNGCKALTSLDLSMFDTSNVTDMTYMFNECESLKSLDISSFNTSKVTDMTAMFHDCRALESLDVSSFTTSNVTSMGEKISVMEDEGMFSGCRSLKTLDLSSFNTSNVKDMGTMFSECYALETVDVSSFDTSSATDLSGMFNGCWGLKNVDVSGFNTSSATNIKRMFMDCRRLESINVSNFDTRNVETMLGLFYGCKSLKTLDLSSFDTSAATDLGEIIYDCTSLKTLKTGTWVYSDYVKNHEYYPTFPVNMKDSATGKIYNAGTNIPEKSNATYSFTDESIVQYRHEPPKTITENDLYGPYYKYLFTSSYESMTRTLINDMAAVNAGRSVWDNVSAVMIGNMKAGAIKSVMNAAYCDATGKYYKQDEFEEELALSYIQELSKEDTGLIEDFIDVLSKESSVGEKAYNIIKAGAKNKKEKEELVKAIQQATKGNFSKSEALNVIRKTEDNYDKISDAFDKVGIAVNAAEIAVTVCISATANKEITQRLINITEHDTSLYNGLMSIRQKQGFTAEEYVKALCTDEVVGKIASEMTKQGVGRFANLFAGNGFIKPGMSTTIASIGYYIVGSIFDKYMASSDEVAKSIIAVSNMEALYRSVVGIRTKMAEAGSGAAFKDDYIFAYKAYLTAIDNSVETVLKAAVDNDDKVKLENDYKKFKKQLTYEKYIKACIENANQKLNYTVSDGKATINGYNKPAIIPLSADSTKAEATSAKASAKKTLNSEESDYVYIDVPEEVDGYPVVAIDEEAFINDKSIGGVFIPDSIESIGNRAFSGCTNIEDIFIGNNVTSLGDQVFNNCTALAEITLPESVTTLGNNVFSGIDNVTVSSKNTEVIDKYCQESEDKVSVAKLSPEIKEISIASPASKQSYMMSEIAEPDEEDYASGKTGAADLTGLTLKAVYDDGSEESVTEGFTAAFQEKKLGESTITVFYEGQSVSYIVSVEADECKYDISYVDEFGTEIAESTKGTAMAGSTITVDDPAIEGYKSVTETSEKTISADNHFIVQYKKIRKPSIGEATITLSETTFDYTGSEIKPEIKVVYDGATLEEGKDYALEYEDNIEIGEAAVEIAGMGDFEGFDIEVFTIVDPNADPCKDGHTFGDWKVTKAATEIAAGEKTRTCSVCGISEKQTIAQLAPTLPAVKIAKPKAAKKSATVKWKKVSKKNLKKIKKIEIQYSLDKNFKTGVVTKYAKAKKTSLKIKKLQSKKTYFVRLRAYTKSGEAVHVSKWSASKKVKAK